VDPIAGLHDVENRKFLTLPGLELRPPRSSSLQAVAIPTELLVRIEYFNFVYMEFTFSVISEIKLSKSISILIHFSIRKCLNFNSG
jgi:hypothetical protein